MTKIRKDDDGRRSIEMSVEVPGTPEAVWQAIATGPGFSAWFTPTEVEEREGGRVRFVLGPEMASEGVVTRFDRPRTFVCEERDWAPGAPPLATEIHVEARAGGTCVVRLVNSLFATTDDWDEQLGGFEKGWAPFLEVLRLYLTHFPGQPVTHVTAMRTLAATEDAAWAQLARPLGLQAARSGDVVRVGDGVASGGAAVPPLAGTVKRAASAEVVVHLDTPAPGVALVSAHVWDGRARPAVTLYLYGDRGAAAAPGAQAAWDAWMDARFAPRQG